GWRDHLDRGASRPALETPPPSIDRSSPPPARDNASWRGRAVSRDPVTAPSQPAPSASAPQAPASPDSPRDVPRRVIDRIGGARVYPGDSVDRGRSSGSGNGGNSAGSRGSSSSPPPQRSSPPPPQRSSPPPSSSGGSSSGGSSSGHSS